VPAYVVMHDATMQLLATERPTRMSALELISGLGETKRARYGEDIIQVIQEYEQT
jgi:ATP-dependent DNA helicase RecQ